MVQSDKTLRGVVALTRLLNRVATPDRSTSVQAAKSRLEDAQKRYRSAKSPDRATITLTDAKDALDIAEEKLAKANANYAIAAEKLRSVKAAQKSSDQLQLLIDAVDTARDRENRAARKVDRLKEEVKLASERLQRAKQLDRLEDINFLELAIETEQGKLSRASIQMRLRQSETQQAEDTLREAQKGTRTPEEIQLLEERLNELQGKVDRAAQTVESAKTRYQQAQEDAQTTEVEYLEAQAELLAAESNYEQITQATAAEQRFERIERTLSKVERFSETSEDIASAIALLPDAEFWWNSICVGATAIVALIYFTPLTAVLQGATKAVKWTASAVSAAKDSVDSVWSPDLQGTPKAEETIAGWVVTSPYGPRVAPVAGASTFHGGVDLADPRGGSYTIGRELYAIGKPRTKVKVTCWQDSGGGGLVATLEPESMPGHIIEYLHLSKCLTGSGRSQTVNANVIIARVGDSGTGNGPHLHVQEKDAGQKVPPRRGIVWWALTGEEPQPIVAQTKTTK